jgi:hypothetical protein
MVLQVSKNKNNDYDLVLATQNAKMDGVEVLEEKNQTRNSMVMISGHV